jgi:hypothetical protein
VRKKKLQSHHTEARLREDARNTLEKERAARSHRLRRCGSPLSEIQSALFCLSCNCLSTVLLFRFGSSS